MSRYRHDLPQMRQDLFLTDGGLETTLIYAEGLDLPLFAAFPLVEQEEGRAALRRYFQPYLDLARARGVGFIIDTPTWRANPDWAARLGFGPADLERVNRLAVAFAEQLRAEATDHVAPIVISGAMGPRGDGYQPDTQMSETEAQSYHAAQIDTFAETAADVISAVTLNYVEEAIGIAKAAKAAGMPVIISFTVETNGCLPTGQSLQAAITQVDEASGGYPAYYMINCAHPRHFAHVLEDRGAWLDRIRGIRANASTRSHAELDAATELDSGDPAALAQDYRAMRTKLPSLCVVGGCCGTDHRHIRAICEAVAPA
ncbi:homocysteine S-methyltransferase family protein [Geminicoccus roseus]|uniref:homocysteine S-methyltransferase family protein n=1 Tax=Geminicoccus roseus TaxID=404900 RepID=UPI00041718B0|nr:homocysteine S-methyltransferase family protein [Geminicoccus roseus]